MLCHKQNYSSAEKQSYTLYSGSVDWFFINSVFVHLVKANISPSMPDKHDKKEHINTINATVFHKLDHNAFI